MQVKEPQFSFDYDTTPETSFQKSDRSGESGCFIATSEIVNKDIEKEIEDHHCRWQGQPGGVTYEKNNGALQKMLDAHTASKV